MKLNLKQISMLLILSAIIFLNSCSSKITITKRHYRKGYHIVVTKKVKEPLKDYVKFQKVSIPPIIEGDKMVKENISSDKGFEASIDTYSLLSQFKNKVKLPHHISLHKTDQNYFVKNWFSLSKLNQEELQVKNITKKNSGDKEDGLSLFWLIILVLLILWLLGFLLGDFGALIHILLVVALILLILWLLRII